MEFVILVKGRKEKSFKILFICGDSDTIGIH